MQTLEHKNERAADPRFTGAFRIYWLAFLLTGHREHGVDVAIETLDSEHAANPFFRTWMLAWSRRVAMPENRRPARNIREL